MTSRAKRRDDARVVAKAAARAGGGDLDTVAELAAVRRDLELVRGYCKTYKTRLERLAMGLQFVQNRIVENKIEAASVAIRSLMSNDAAEARETVGNRRMALELAAQRLELVASTMDRTMGMGKSVQDDLDKIRLLAPESFGGEVAMTAPAAGKA